MTLANMLDVDTNSTNYSSKELETAIRTLQKLKKAAKKREEEEQA